MLPCPTELNVNANAHVNSNVEYQKVCFVLLHIL